MTCSKGISDNDSKEAKGDYNTADFSGSDWKAGRDINVHIGTKIEKNELKKQGFDLDVDPREVGLIRIGRWLLKKLGTKIFISIFSILLGGPAIYIGYGIYISRENSLFMMNNFLWTFFAILILIFSVTILFSGLNSKCQFCKNIFATVPVKKTLIDSAKYKGRELYKINEIRRCEFCGKISSIGYNKEYVEEEND
jgi:hypothetical protein